MEMDQTTPLKFDHLHVGEPQGLAHQGNGDAGVAGEMPGQVDAEPFPEASDVGLPDDRSLIVVTVGAQWVPT